MVVLIWADGKELSTKPRGPEEPKLAAQHPDEGSHDSDGGSRRDLLMRWKSSVSDLMAWLDWSVWVRCRPKCSYDEMYYPPTWPYFFHRRFGDEEGWKRPQPICIPGLGPYDLYKGCLAEDYKGAVVLAVFETSPRSY